MTTPGTEDTQARHQRKEVMRQEQFWFSGTTLGFIGFVGALLQTPTLRDLCICLGLIWALTAFTVFLIIDRHRAYCKENDIVLRGWSSALTHALAERSGALYCTVVVLFAALGFTLIIFMRYPPPTPLTPNSSSPTARKP